MSKVETAVKLTAKQLEVSNEVVKSSATHTLFYGGGGSGKTFLICLYIIKRALQERSTHLIVRNTVSEVKQNLFNLNSGTVFKCLDALGMRRSEKARKSQMFYLFNASDLIITFYNGSQIIAGNMDSITRYMGQEYSTCYFNECAGKEGQGKGIDYEKVKAITASRIRENTKLKKRVFYDLNPTTKIHWCYRLFIEKVYPNTLQPVSQVNEYDFYVLNPEDNREHLAESYFTQDRDSKEEARFIKGVWLDEVEGALWNLNVIRDCKTKECLNYNSLDFRYDFLDKVVIGVDPAVTSGESSDLSGIVVVGRGKDKNWYVLDDVSGRYDPARVVSKVEDIYHKWEADAVVVEVNNGGDWIEAEFKKTDISIKQVRANKSKEYRMGPVVSRYEQGKVLHCVGFKNFTMQKLVRGTDVKIEKYRLLDLENEMLSYNPSFTKKSPDRIDALVWACTYLLELERRVSRGVLLNC